ncbi:hypothetical protein AFI02nite_38800 [Aliivibrio fischeri]|nr:hypothetical protein AFI02nite_38800 [Aliivibrio fischeri]
MLEGLGCELDASRIYATDNKTTAEESRLAGLDMVRRLNKEK